MQHQIQIPDDVRLRAVLKKQASLEAELAAFKRLHKEMEEREISLRAELTALRAAPRSETEGRDKERLDALDLMAVEMVEGTDCVSLTLFMKPGQKIRDAIDDLTSSVLAHEQEAGE